VKPIEYMVEDITSVCQ